jgi:hypothetical protein
MAGHTLFDLIAHYSGFCMKLSVMGLKLNLILYVHQIPLMENTQCFADVVDMRTFLIVCDLSENL